MEGADHRLLQLLEKLLNLPALQLTPAMASAATCVAEWFACDKVDAFLLDEARSSLVAVGTSETPLGRRQKELGLDALPLANGGILVREFQRGRSFITGRADLDPDELSGIVNELGVRSELNVILSIGGVGRGVLSVVDQRPDRFDESDLKLLEVVGRWLGALAHRAELAERLRAEETARARTVAAEQIVTVLSHDIRNHLHPLSGRLLLHQQRLRRGDVVDPATLDPAISAVRRLARLTNSWLDVARLDRDLFELELEPVELCDLLRRVIAPLTTSHVPIQLVAGSGLTVLGDQERLTQAFETVIANGLRHAPAGSPLRVTVEDDADRAMARVLVSDEGPGIPQELLPHLFERFVSTRPSRGIGLGLYLAKRVLEAHGGSLTVRSEPGAGACFCFELPHEGPLTRQD
jgi:two-component system, OmpR family, sensor kinase